MENRLQPMGVREIMDYTFSILKEYFWSFQGLIFWAFLPLVIGMIGLGGLLIGAMATVLVGQAVMGRDLTDFFNSFLSNAGPLALFVVVIPLIILVLVMVCLIYLNYGMVKLFVAGLHREKCGARQCFTGIKGKRLRIFWFLTFSIGFGLLLGGVSTFFKEPLYYLWAQVIANVLVSGIGFLFSLIIPVLVVEDQGVLNSLRRAFKLLKGQRWRALGILSLVYLLGYVLYLVILALIMGPLVLAIYLRNIILFLAAGLLCLAGILIFNAMIAYFYGPITLLYFDLRIRKEGYDLEQDLRRQMPISPVSNEGSIGF